ncbi:hypothetical protein [Novosphingobium sp. FKTRR1]|uniref:hypothetical protein n=1 Tax=Novosphingobium sp. FKTRR1 TaxID=2879118 RepID=UPI001CEFB6E8|nr:hypothetical protein [Novosphingobium sp. FKTRR1]
MNIFHRFLGVGLSSAHQAGVGPSAEITGGLFIDTLPDVHFLAEAMTPSGMERQQVDPGQFASLCPAAFGVLSIRNF